VTDLQTSKIERSVTVVAQDVVTLRDYVQLQIDGLQNATRVAHNAMEQRLEGMNEFRSQMKDQQARFVTQSEYNESANRNREDIRVLRESRAMLEGKASQSSVNATFLLAAVSIVCAIVSLIVQFVHMVKG
jgi:hypothetical protein